MMMNLMTVLVKKVFISSKPSIVCLLCPPPCGPFSIQESAVGGLSYKAKKNVPWHILAPRRGCFSNHLPLRRVRILVKHLLSYGNEVSYTIKKNVPWHILAPRRGCFSNHLPLRRVRILAERFLSYGNEVSYTMKKNRQL